VFAAGLAGPKVILVPEGGRWREIHNRVIGEVILSAQTTKSHPITIMKTQVVTEVLPRCSAHSIDFDPRIWIATFA